jgi:hypothetical protein
MECSLVEVGCIGFCAVEPIVDIKLPGRNRISFHGVTHDRAAVLLESMLVNRRAPEDMALLQVPGEEESWEGVPGFGEHPFFAPQTRWVLENCGIMDPVSMEEYLAAGGYKAFARALRTLNPEQVCDTGESSVLRGRAGGGFPTGKKWRFAPIRPRAPNT